MKWILSLCMALLFFSGCNVDKRNERRLEAYSVQYKGKFAELANQEFPCNAGKVRSDTVIRVGKADTLREVDTTMVYSMRHDTVVQTKIKRQIVSIPVYTTIRDTFQDERAVAAIQDRLDQKSDSLVKVITQHQTAVETSWTMGIIAGVLLLSWIVFIVFKVIK